jgi:hypothetical protein
MKPFGLPRHAVLLIRLKVKAGSTYLINTTVPFSFTCCFR